MNKNEELFKAFKIFKTAAPLFFVAFICTTISALLNGVTILSILPFVDIVFTQKKIVLPVNLPPLFANFVDKLNLIEPLTLFNILIISIIPFFIVKGIFFWLQGYFMNGVALRTVRQVRARLFEKLQELSLDYYSRQRTGELMSRIINDVGCINNSITFALKDLVHESLRLFIYIFIVIAVGGKVSLITLILLPLIVWPASRIGKKIKKLSLRTQEKKADITSLLEETISGVRIVKAFSMEKYEIDRFKKHNNELLGYMLKSAKRTLISTPLSEIAGAVATTLVLAIWGRALLAGTISFGGFGMVMGSLMSIMQPMKKLTGVHFVTQVGLAASNRIYEILDEKVTVKEPVHPIKLKTLKNTIKFENIWFKYDQSSKYVLKGVDLIVNRTDFIAIVGASGAGKTTLVNLIPRFYDPQIGRVLIDGVDIKKISINSLRSIIAVVTQEMVIFNTTVRDNIAYGRKDASEKDIIEATKKAFAYKFITDLPLGFDTIVGDRGFRLSGGEKQRMVIARAFLKNAPILILDEATSNLDSESEKLIQSALHTLIEGKTVFVIAHRFSTVQDASRIIVLDGNKIIEEGRHSDLIENSNVYKKLYNIQYNL